MGDKSPSWPYTINDSVLGGISRVERGLGAISRAPILPELRQSLRKQARRRSSRASAGIEGVLVNEQSVQAIDRGLVPASRDEREVAALIRLYEWVQGQPVGYVVSEADCRRLHQLVWDKIVVKTMTGRYRNEAVAVWDGPKLVYEAPASEELPSLMAHFGQWLRALPKAGIHPIIAAGVAQFEFIRIHPFMDGNGRSSRGLSALVLRSFDYDAGGLLAHEDQILRRIDEFYASIEAAQNERDMTPWLDFYVLSLAEEVEAVLESVESLNASEPGFRLAKLRLNARQRALLQAMRVEGRLSARDVNVPQQTFHRDMQRLIEGGLVMAVGEKRGRVYVLASRDE
ncbi:MAG: Fic family protein [Chloroflexota bacterium]